MNTHLRPMLLLVLSLAFLWTGSSFAQDRPTRASDATEAKIPDIRMTRAWPGVTVRRPVQLVSRPDRDDVLYIVEQLGRIRTVDGSDTTSKESELVIDITDRVNARSNEEGLLSIVFHPDFAENNEVYFYYTAAKSGSKPRRAVLSRFRMDDERRLFDPDDGLVSRLEHLGRRPRERDAVLVLRSLKPARVARLEAIHVLATRRSLEHHGCSGEGGTRMGGRWVAGAL